MLSLSFSTSIFAQFLVAQQSQSELYLQIGCVVAGFLLGLLIMWLMMRAKFSSLRTRQEEQHQQARSTVGMLEAKAADLENKLAELRHTEVLLLKRQGELEGVVTTQETQQEIQKRVLEEMEGRVTSIFRAFSQSAQNRSQQEIAALLQKELKGQQETTQGLLDERQKAVEKLLSPVTQSVDKLQKQVEQFGEKREAAESSLRDKVEQLDNKTQSLGESLLLTLEKQQAAIEKQKPNSVRTDNAFAPLPALDAQEDPDSSSAFDDSESNWDDLGSSPDDSSGHNFEGFTLDDTSQKATSAADDFRKALGEGD